MTRDSDPLAPLAFSDKQLGIIIQLAAPLSPFDRGAYLRRLAQLAASGDTIGSAVRAQGELLEQRQPKEGA